MCEKRLIEEIALSEKRRQIIEDLTSEIFDLNNKIESLNMIIVRYEDLRAIDEKYNQVKISFAVEQLEKVKSVEQDYDDLIDLRNRIKECSDGDVQLYEEDAIILDHILDHIERINNQIKQLKEGK